MLRVLQIAILVCVGLLFSARAAAADRFEGTAEARQILIEASEAAAAIEHRELRAAVLSVVAGWQALAGDVSALLKTIALRDTDGDSPQEEIAVAQAQAGDATGALKTAEAIQKAEAKAPMP